MVMAVAVETALDVVKKTGARAPHGKILAALTASKKSIDEK